MRDKWEKIRVFAALSSGLFKEALCSLGEEIQIQNFYIYNINELMIQTQITQITGLFSEENKVPGHCLKIERWQGPPHVDKVKQYGTVLCFKVGLFI